VEVPHPNTVTLAPGLVSTSADEVERVLQALLIRREPLAALDAAGQAHSRWRLCLVDTGRQYVVVEPVAASRARTLPARPLATFVAEFGGMQIEFTAADPQPSAHAPDSVRVGFPRAVVTRQRRAHPRAQVPPDFPVSCAIPTGPAAVLQAEIMDISEGGIGLLVHEVSIVPAPGTRITGCSIASAAVGTVLVDLEVRHVRPVALASGARAQRWGCQFVDPSEKVRELIAKFASE
jgi:c-di-GMP-binding flagellar brake protein YcgR